MQVLTKPFAMEALAARIVDFIVQALDRRSSIGVYPSKAPPRDTFDVSYGLFPGFQDATVRGSRI